MHAQSQDVYSAVTIVSQIIGLEVKKNRGGWDARAHIVMRAKRTSRLPLTPPRGASGLPGQDRRLGICVNLPPSCNQLQGRH